MSEVDPTIAFWSGLTPYVYGQKMKDGQGVVVRVPNVCSRVRSLVEDWNYRHHQGVYREIFPWIAVYEDADAPRFGWAYLTEDAYASPLSDLKFLGTQLEPAKMEDFQRWRETEGPKNIVKEHMVDVYGGRLGTTIFLKRGPDTVIFGAGCYAEGRFPIPEPLKEEVRALWPAERPRFWRLPRNKPEDLHRRRWMLEEAIRRSRIDGTDIHNFHDRIRKSGGGVPANDPSGPVYVYPTILRDTFSELQRLQKAGQIKVEWRKLDLPPTRVPQGQYWDSVVTWLGEPPPRWEIIVDEKRRGFGYCTTNIMHSNGHVRPFKPLGAPQRELHNNYVIGGEIPTRVGDGATMYDSVIYERDQFVYLDFASAELRELGGGLK